MNPIPSSSSHPITLPVGELKVVLQGLGKLINRRATATVLSMIHAERTSDGSIFLTATDLDRFAQVKLERSQSGRATAMSLLIPYEDLQQIVKACPREEVIYVEPGHHPNQVLLRFPLARKAGESKLPSLPVSEFPVIPKVDGKAEILPDQVRHHLHEAMSCVSSDATRYVLNGAYVDVDNPDASYLVGTDGTHLYSSNSFQLKIQTSVIVPPHRFLGWRPFNQDGEWQIRIGKLKVQEHPSNSEAMWVQIQTHNWCYISKVIEGQYPRWKQVVPDIQQSVCRLTLHPDSLEELVREIELLPCADEKFRTLGLEWYNGKLHMLVREAPEGPWLRILVEQVRGEGDEVTVFCNRKYLLKALRFGLNTIQLINEQSPLRFSQGGRQLIIMPIRTEAVGPLPSRVPKSLPAEHKRVRQAEPLNSSIEARGSDNTRIAPPAIKEESSEPARRVDVYEETLSQLRGLRDTLRQSLNVIGALALSVRHLRSNQRHLVRDLQRNKKLAVPASPAVTG